MQAGGAPPACIFLHKMVCNYVKNSDIKTSSFALDALAGSKVVPVPHADLPLQPQIYLTGTPFSSAYVTPVDKK